MSQSPSSGPSGTSDPFSAPSSPAEQPLEAGVGAPYGAYQAGYQAGYPGAAPRYGMPGLPPVVKSMKAPWILLASGVTMMVLAIVGIALTIGAFLNATSLQPLDSNGTTTVTLEGGKEYGLFGDGYANCDYTGPGTIEEGSVTGDVTVNDKSELLTLTPSASGEYVGLRHRHGGGRVPRLPVPRRRGNDRAHHRDRLGGQAQVVEPEGPGLPRLAGAGRYDRLRGARAGSPLSLGQGIAPSPASGDDSIDCRWTGMRERLDGVAIAGGPGLVGRPRWAAARSRAPPGPRPP